MVPSAFLVLERPPLTPNGKLDRKALPPPPESYAPGPDGSYVAPRTPTEEVLARIWSEALNLKLVKQVSIHDNFIELGGHSLLGIRLVNEVNRRCNVKLRVIELYKNPTVEQLALSIDGAEVIGHGPRIVRLKSGDAQTSVYFVYAGPDEFRLAQYISEGS
jgi:hypothetical protein